MQGVDASLTIGLAGLVLAAISAFATGYFFQGRRWRDVADAREAAHNLTKEFLAGVVAELAAEKEKVVARDDLLEARDARIARMAERLEQLDEERKEYAGSKVYEMLQAQHTETLIAFKGLSENQRKTGELLRDGITQIVECFNREKGNPPNVDS